MVTERFPVNGLPHRGEDLSIRDESRLLIDGSEKQKEYLHLDADRLGDQEPLDQSEWSEADETGFQQLRRWLREDRRRVR